MPGEKKIDSLFIEVLLDSLGVSQELNNLKREVSSISTAAKPSLDAVDAGLADIAQGASQASAEAAKLESNLAGTSKAAVTGGQQAAQGVRKLTQELSAADRRAQSLVNGIRERFKSLVMGFVPVIAGGAAIMATFGSMASELGELDQLMQSANLNLEQLARRQELLNRYGEDGSKKYRQMKEGMEKFRVATIQAVWPIVEMMLPALTSLVREITEIFEFLRKNEPFAKALIIGLAAIIVTALIPTIISMGAALWGALAPVLPILLAVTAAVGVIALLVDDFVAYLNGEGSAFEEFWQLFAEGETYAERVENALKNLKIAFEWLIAWLEIAFAPILAIFDAITGGIDAVIERITGNKIIQAGAELLGIDLSGEGSIDNGIGGTSGRAGMYGGTSPAGENLVPAMVNANAPQAAGITSDVRRGANINTEQNNNITVYAKSDNPQGIADETVKALGSQMALTSETGIRR